MTKTYAIDINRALTPAADLAALGNYRGYFAGNANVVALWDPNDADRVTITGGKIASIADSLGGPAVLTQATAGKRATLVYDTILSRNVARLTKADGVNYTQVGGGVIDNAEPWTLVALHKPATFDFATLVNVGATAMMGVSTSGGSPVLTAGTGGTSIADAPQSTTGWNRQIVSHPGGASIRQQVAGRQILTNAGGAAPAGTGLVIGNNTPGVAYGGDLALLLAIKSIDALADETSDLFYNIGAFFDVLVA